MLENFNGQKSTDKKTLISYSHDASLFEIVPKAVVFPKNVTEIKELVVEVNAIKSDDPSVSITARSGGTDMSGGSINSSILVDFTKYFNGTLEVNTEPVFKNDKNQEVSGSAVVLPGTYYRDFEPKTLEKGLIMPTFPASRELCTVGGMVANNSGGELSIRYGQTKDYVRSLKAVLSDGQEYEFKKLNRAELEEKKKLPNFEGEIYRRLYSLLEENFDLIKSKKPSTSKNSAGYFLWDIWDRENFNPCRLLAGSQGTLGLVTEITFDLVKSRRDSRLLVIFLKDLDILGELVDSVMKHDPITFESYDDNTFKLAMKFLPGLIKKMKGNIFSFGLKFLPEVMMTITGGIPKMILIAEFTGDNPEEIFSKISEVEKMVKEKFDLKTHITRTEAESAKYWTMRRESFSLLREHSKGLSTAPFIDDIIVHPSDLPRFLPELNAILSKYKKIFYTIAGHAGDANFHIIPLMDLKDEDNRRAIAEISDKVYDLVLRYQGSITAEHNDGLIRTPYLEKMYGASMVELFRQVKEIFDPKNIFNPGKKVGGSIEKSLALLKKE